MKNTNNSLSPPHHLKDRDSSYGQSTQQRKPNLKMKKMASPNKKLSKISGNDLNQNNVVSYQNQL